jgi:hypothetical protein
LKKNEKERDHLENPRVDGIILKQILNKNDVKM